MIAGYALIPHIVFRQVKEAMAKYKVNYSEGYHHHTATATPEQVCQELFGFTGPSAQQQSYRVLADGASGLIFQHKNGHSGITW